MKIIIKPRRAGKTTELIKRCAKEGGYIVCRKDSVHLIQSMAKEMNVDISFPITYDEFIKGQFYRPGVEKLHIDDADELITRIAKNFPIANITLTGQ